MTAEPMEGAADANGDRKVVLHPQTAAARRGDRARAFGGHVRGFTVDNDDVFALVSAQRRLSLTLLGIVVVPVLCLPLLFSLVPSASTARPFGLLPLPWLLLGPVILFSIVAAAAVHGVLAGRLEERWTTERHNP